jgi:hypothetical protein
VSSLPWRLGLVVEGEGDKNAMPLLLARLATDLGLPLPVLDRNLKLPTGNLIERNRKIEVYTRNAGLDALLVIHDDEDGCPKKDAPAQADALRALRLPFPTALVLMYREYETIFLPSIATLAGAELKDERGVPRKGLLPGTVFPDQDFERPRGVKEWLSKRMAPGRTYKETVDQLSMTRLLDFDAIRRSGLPCFGSLERALRFLVANQGQRGAVYPEAAGDTRKRRPDQPPRMKKKS